MTEFYQKVAYIGLRNPDGSFFANIPLYVKLNEVSKNGISQQQNQIIHTISEIMMQRYEKQLSEFITNKKKGAKNNANV